MTASFPEEVTILDRIGYLRLRPFRPSECGCGLHKVTDQPSDPV